MNNYQTANKKAKFFEGWYFKHQIGNKFLILIPGICAKKNPKGKDVEDSLKEYGAKFGFIQIITNSNSYCLYYPISECTIAKDMLSIKIGDNIFRQNGIKLNILSKEISLKGNIEYGRLGRIRYPIMGVFQYVPHMECNHEIISMQHNLQGSIRMNGANISFNHGIGYIEKDWGYSFPKSYIWVQCNSFTDGKCALTLSIADIPFGKFSFTGCIGMVHYEGMEYRFATYLGVRILTYNSKEIQVKQGKYLLRIQLGTNHQNVPYLTQTQSVERTSCRLLAPDNGSMLRTIKEQNLCPITCQLFEGSRLVFDKVCKTASVEIVE